MKLILFNVIREINLCFIVNYNLNIFVLLLTNVELKNKKKIPFLRYIFCFSNLKKIEKFFGKQKEKKSKRKNPKFPGLLKKNFLEFFSFLITQK